MRNMLRKLAFAALGAFLLTSCEYKELCYDHSHVVDLQVNFDWSGVGNKAEANPAGMSAYFFGGHEGELKSGRALIDNRYDITGKDGGKIRIEWGRYDVLGLNYDTEAILFRNMDDPETFEAYTRASSLEEGTQIATKVSMPKASGTETQKVVLEPDMLWAGMGDRFSVEMGENNASTTVHLAQRVTHFTVILENVPNLNYTSQFGGSISGLAGGVKLASGELTDECVILPFPIRKEGPTTLVAEFNSFGHCPGKEDHEFEQHILTIYAILADGSKWYYTKDVSDQIHDPLQNPDQYNIILEIEDLPVPKPIVNGSGFKPDIDGWDTEEISVGM